MDIRKSNINNISEYLYGANSALTRIIETANHIHQAQDNLVLELAPEFINHFWVGTYQNGLLSVFVDSAILATKLRFYIPDIRDKLRKQPQWSGLKSIEVKIMVTKTTFATPIKTPMEKKILPPKKLDLSKETIEQINNLADNLEKLHDNQEVAKALRGIVTISHAEC